MNTMQTIRYSNGKVYAISYKVVDLPVRFEYPPRRFRSAWKAC